MHARTGVYVGTTTAEARSVVHQLFWQLRTELWGVAFSRLRPLGPMLALPAWELWPFFVRFSAPSPESWLSVPTALPAVMRSFRYSILKS